MKNSARRLRPVTVTFCTMSIILWLLSTSSSKLVFGDNYGLISSLGPLYYAAVALVLFSLGLACLDAPGDWKVGLFSLFILQTELYLTFNFMWGFTVPPPQSPNPNALYYGISNLISQQGGLQGLFPSPFAWPGILILGSILLQVTGIGNVTTASILVVWLLLVSDLLFFFVLMYRVLRGFRASLLGGLCFIIGAWTLPVSFNDVGFSVSLVLTFLMLAFESGRATKKWTRVTILIVVTATVITNPYAAFSILGILAVYSLSPYQNNIQKHWIPVFVSGMVAFGLWYFISNVDLLAAYSSLINRLFNLEFLYGQLAAKYTGSTSHRLVVLSGEALTALLGLISAIGVVKRRRSLGSSIDRRIILSLMGLILAWLILGPAYALGSSITYSAVETVERIWVFGFFFVSYYAVRLFGRRHMVTLIILLGLLIPVFLLANSGDLGLYAPPSGVYGGVYVVNHVTSAYVLEIDNFTTLDGLYCWRTSCLGNFTPVQAHFSSDEVVVANFPLPYTRSAVLISTSSYNAYLVEALTGNSTTYVTESELLLTTPGVDVVYSTIGMNVMASAIGP